MKKIGRGDVSKILDPSLQCQQENLEKMREVFTIKMENMPRKYLKVYIYAG